jgi:hypothetical protein
MIRKCAISVIAALARLLGPGGIRSVVAESVLVKHQLLNLDRSRQRAPSLRTSDRLVSALQKAKAEGIEGSICTHPIGCYGHGSGMMLGMVEKQCFVPGTGEHPLYPSTSYSIELGASHVVPEWANAKISMGLEDEAIYTKEGAPIGLMGTRKSTVKEVDSFEKRQAVAVTLENCYDEWRLAQMAKELNKQDDYAYFMRRARNYEILLASASV